MGDDFSKLARDVFSMAKSAARTATCLRRDPVARATWLHFALDDLKRAIDYRETARAA